MITSMACICGGIGEFALLAAIVSGIGWLWRKLRRKTTKGCDNHACCKPDKPIKGSHTHM